MNILKYKFALLFFSLALVLASVFGVAAFGLKKGIDFTGGSLWHIRFSESVDQSRLAELFQKDFGFPEAVVSPQEGESAFFIRSKEMDEQKHQEIFSAIKKEFESAEELSFQSIGSVIGEELVRRAILAFLINLGAIALYVAYAFRKVSYPVSSWKYAFVTLITLFHDAIIPVGLFAFLGRFTGAEIDTNFIVAILVVIGFSVHDTIVVFDRIRENVRTRNVEKEGFENIVNSSVLETFARSVNTSLTLVVVLLAMLFFGSESLKHFILVILVGTVAGTYSSIFVASPLLSIWRKKGQS